MATAWFAKDTEFGNTWDGFKSIISGYGFEVVLSDNYSPKWGGEVERVEELIVAYHDAKGLLLCATSYLGNLNGGHVYGEVELPKGADANACYMALGSFSGGCITSEGEPMRYEVSYDVRYGILSVFERIARKGLVFCQQWTKRKHHRHLWLLDYAQEQESKQHTDQYSKGGFFDRCRNERIARLPAHIQQRIAYAEVTP